MAQADGQEGSGRGALEDLTVLVTRAEDQAPALSLQLKQHGANVIERSLIKFDKPDSYQALDQALNEINQWDWIVFASSNAVAAVAERCTTLGITLDILDRTRIATIGSATASKLQALLKLESDFQPSSFVAEQFVLEFSKEEALQGKRILWPRTNVGRTLIADKLTELGARVNMVEAYTTSLPDDASNLASELEQLILEGKIDAITLLSSQTVKNFASIIGLADKHSKVSPEDNRVRIEKLMQNVVVATIGPVTAKTAESLLGRVDVQANHYTVDGLVESLIRYFQDKRSDRHH